MVNIFCPINFLKKIDRFWIKLKKLEKAPPYGPFNLSTLIFPEAQGVGAMGFFLIMRGPYQTTTRSEVEGRNYFFI